MMRWQWHQLDHMQIICTSIQTDNKCQHLIAHFLQAGWMQNKKLAVFAE